MRLGTDYKIRDERTGIAVRGRITRALIIASSVAAWRGYQILRDPPTRERSDEMLLSFLASTASTLGAGGAMLESAAAAAR